MWLVVWFYFLRFWFLQTVEMYTQLLLSRLLYVSLLTLLFKFLMKILRSFLCYCDWCMGQFCTVSFCMHIVQSHVHIRTTTTIKVLTWASSDTDTSGGNIIKPAATRQCLKVLRIKTVTVKGAATPPAIRGTRHSVSTNGHARQSIIICSVRSHSLRGSPLDLQIRSNWVSTPPPVDMPCSLISHEKSPVQFSSVRDGIYMRSEKPICAPPRLSEVPSLKQLQYSFLTDDGLFSCLTWKICRALPLSASLSSACDVSSSSTL